MCQGPCSWPPPPPPVLGPACDGLEIKATCSVTTQANSWLINKFSSFIMLKRVLVWTLRFVHNLNACKNHSELKLTATIQLQELQDAEQFLLKQSQARWFSTEFKQLFNKDTLNNSGVMLPLRPFLDKKQSPQGGRKVDAISSEVFKVSSSHRPWQGSTYSFSGQSSPSRIMSCWTNVIDATTQP